MFVDTNKSYEPTRRFLSTKPTRDTSYTGKAFHKKLNVPTTTNQALKRSSSTDVVQNPLQILADGNVLFRLRAVPDIRL